MFPSYIDKKATVIDRVLSENRIVGFIHLDGLERAGSGGVQSKDT